MRQSISTKEKKMQLKVYSIRDRKTEVYNTPFFQKSHGEAERSFTSMSMDTKSTINMYPEDYDLYYIGEYDTDKGLLIPLDSPLHVSKAIEVIDRIRSSQLNQQAQSEATR